MPTLLLVVPDYIQAWIPLELRIQGTLAPSGGNTEVMGEE